MKNINFPFYVMFFYLNLFNNINSNTYLFNNLKSNVDYIINIYDIIFLSALILISLILFLLSYILLVNGRPFLIDDLTSLLLANMSLNVLSHDTIWSKIFPLLCKARRVSRQHGGAVACRYVLTPAQPGYDRDHMG